MKTNRRFEKKPYLKFSCPTCGCARGYGCIMVKSPYRDVRPHKARLRKVKKKAIPGVYIPGYGATGYGTRGYGGYALGGPVV